MASAQPESLPGFKFHWEYILATGVLAGVAAVIASNLSGLKPQRYTQLIVGYLTWHLGAKQPDYVLLLSILVGFFLIYIGFYTLANAIRQRQGEGVETAFRQLLIFSLLPIGILLGKVFVNTKDINPGVMLEFLGGSLFLVLVTIGLAIGLLLKRVSPLNDQEYVETMGGSLLFVFFSFFAGSALALAIGRLHSSWQLTNIDTVTLVSGLGALLLWLPLLKIWLERFSDLSHVRSKLRGLLWAVQGFFPLFFLVLVPMPWINGTEKTYGYPIAPALFLFMGGCITIAYIDWVRRFSPPLELEKGNRVFSAVSPLGLIALLLYIKVSQVNVSAVLPDDYHWGEYLLPWWLWQNFHYIPFWDYEPSRGLVNYFIGALASLFFDGTAIAYQVVSTSGLLMLPYLTLSFLVLMRTIGILPAFLACLLAPMANGLSEIDCVVTIVLCSLGSVFLKWRWSQWVMVWGIASVALLLFAPGQGGLLILSMLPLAGFALVQAFFKERQRLLKVVVSMVVLLLLSLVTPFGKMLVGAIRYGVEQSSINSVAHGIPWALSANSNPVLNYLLWEVVRTAWVLVGITAGLFLFRAVVDKTWTERYRYAVFGLPIFLLLVLFIPRAAGRIDPGFMSRLGATSEWAVCFLLPIVLFTACDQRKKALSLMLIAFLGGIVVGLPTPDSLLGKPTRTINVSAFSKLSADRLGLPNLAHNFIAPAQFDRLQAMKQVLNAAVDPGETYLDLTNRNANYFYLGYPPPAQASAFYNLPHPNQQLRALQKLEATPPPIVLASADNLLLDGSTLALRAHLVYRYVVERYTPIVVDKFIYMVRPDRLERLKTRLASVAPNSKIEVGDTQDRRLNLLDQIFLAGDLQKIPRAWGASFESLQATLQPVKTLDATMITTQHAVEKTGQTTYRIAGKEPSLTFNIETLKLNGKDAGILAFDFSSNRPRALATIQIDWEGHVTDPPGTVNRISFSVKNGKVLVPLDDAPRWLLTEGIKTIRLAIVEPVPFKAFTLSNVALFQRTELQKH